MPVPEQTRRGRKPLTFDHTPSAEEIAAALVGRQETSLAITWLAIIDLARERGSAKITTGPGQIVDRIEALGLLPAFRAAHRLGRSGLGEGEMVGGGLVALSVVDAAGEVLWTSEPTCGDALALTAMAETLLVIFPAAQAVAISRLNDGEQLGEARRPGTLSPEEQRAADVAAGLPVCRGCGCTDNAGCDEGCSWVPGVEPPVCSACWERAEVEAVP